MLNYLRNMNQLKIVIIISLLGMLFACQVKESPPQEPVAKSFVACQEPRRLMCTREYNPVCAKRDTGVRCIKSPCPADEYVTKPNACSACADEKVSEYRLGACSSTE